MDKKVDIIEFIVKRWTDAEVEKTETENNVIYTIKPKTEQERGIIIGKGGKTIIALTRIALVDIKAHKDKNVLIEVSQT